MDATGRWKAIMSTPAGPQAMLLTVLQDGDTFTGRVDSPMGHFDIVGAVAGNTLEWVMKAKTPVPITVTFMVSVEGETLTGTAKLGVFGKSTVTGERVGDGEITQAPSSPEAAGPVTGTSVDPVYNDPYVDLDELRQDPVPHRYVHGGFRGTDARFSFYFPPAERYEGRFFHNTYPMATSEDIGPFPIEFAVATGDLGFTIDSGAYYVQTNLGGADRAGGMADPAIAAFRVNAAAAKYSREVAAKLYGDHRPHGYLFGGSGGAYQVLGSAENTQGVWDGFVPFVIGSTHAIPSMFTVRMNALRVLRRRDRFPAILDAINPGGGGDPHAELNEEESAALREATRMGFPPRGWWAHETMTSGYFMQVAPMIPMLDPGYVDDFWTKPGYLGADGGAGLSDARFQFDTTIAEVIDGFPRRIVLADTPERDFSNAHLVLLSGAAEGKSIPIANSDDRTLRFAFAADQAALGAIQPGDKARIDTSWGLALETYHRHQVPTPDLVGWNQFRGEDGRPIPPQRDILIGPFGAENTAGAVLRGHIHGKVLAVDALMDIDALPWQADWYRSKVKDALGSRFEDHFAIWFIDHAQHDDPMTPQAQAHTVSYRGALQQALRDVAAWVEKGVRPSETRYAVIDSQVHVPATAAARQGVQPVVTLAANGGERAEASVGQAVDFEAIIETPAGAGKVVAAEWDFEGLGAYAATARIDTPQARVRLVATHAYDKPGTYYAVLRATAQRQGDAATPYGRVQNIARVRIVVA